MVSDPGHWPELIQSKTTSIQYVLVYIDIWVVAKIMVPFWVPNIIRHLLFRVPKRGTIILRTTHIHILH